MAYISIVPGKIIKGDMAFMLAMVWAHPHQAPLSSLDVMARKLPLLINIGDIWAYTFMQLNEGILHVPLSNKGRMSTMIDGVTSRKTCGHLCQLEVCKLLQCGDQVVCPKGLNRGLEPLLLSFPKPPVLNMDALSRPVHKPSLLQVDLPSVRLRDQTPITPCSLWSLNTTFLSTFCHEVSLWNSYPPQYGHWASRALIPSGSGHLQLSLRGQHPKETSISDQGCPIDHQNGRPTLARQASFGHAQAKGYLPAGVTASGHA